jgi:curved DNA-binding protein CbpA
MDRKIVLATKLAEIITGAIGKNPHSRLVFSNQDSKKVFEFSDGMIVNLDSTEVTEKYAALLLMSKLVDQDELRRAAQPDRKSWEVDEELIAQRGLSPEQTKKIFSLQLSRITHSLLEWPSINFKVSVTDSGPSERRKKNIYVQELLLHLFRTAPDPDVTARIDSQKDYQFTFDSERLPVLLTLPLNSQEGYVLSRVKGRLTPSQVADSGPVSFEKVLDTLAIFSRLGFLQCLPDSARRTTTGLLPKLDIPAPETGTAPAAVASTPAAPPAPSSPVEAAIELKRMLDEFRSLREEMEAKDYYDILEVTRGDFSASQLKTNYYAFAKKYHPDKFRKYGSDALNDTLEHVLNLMNTAYETLKDPERRDEYDRDLNTGRLKSGAGGSAAQQTRVNMDQIASDNFNQGKNLIQVQKYAEAVSFLKRAVQIKPDSAEFLAYLGYAMSKIPQYRRESERHFLRSIQINPMNTNTYIHLGRMYKEVRMLGKALEAFQSVLRWDPENRVALQEIEELTGSKKSKGFLGNLFKK